MGVGIANLWGSASAFGAIFFVQKATHNTAVLACPLEQGERLRQREGSRLRQQEP